MQRHRRKSANRSASLIALALAGAATVAVAQAPVSSPELLPQTPPSKLSRAVAPAAGWMGVHSCTARACHGHPGNDRVHPGVWGNEHAVWQERDPHARAYQVLFDQRSVEMARRLGLPAAHQSQRCLVCHAPAAGRVHANETLLGEGVGCEACHGAAEKWLAAHTTAGWSSLDPHRKQREFGLTPTKGLVARARLCAECHVGTADRDVNHDLIAAGHPRLTFEFASHSARMPAHWNEQGTNDRRRYGDFEARVWVIGRLAALEAQLELLAARAAAADAAPPRAPWPELAEYHCYGCHQQLRPASSSASLGLPAWNSWNQALMPILADEKQAPSGLLARLEAINVAMSKLNNDPAETARQAAAAAADVELWLTQIAEDRYDLASITQWQRLLSHSGQRLEEADWDQAAQIYLGLAAMQQSSLDTRRQFHPADAAMREALGNARRKLLFPTVTADGRIQIYDSPREYSWPAARESLDAIHQLLNRRERQ